MLILGAVAGEHHHGALDPASFATERAAQALPSQQPPRSAAAGDRPATLNPRTPTAEPNAANPPPGATPTSGARLQATFDACAGSPTISLAAAALAGAPAAPLRLRTTRTPAADASTNRQPPLPQPAPQPTVERNPYLRRR